MYVRTTASMAGRRCYWSRRSPCWSPGSGWCSGVPASGAPGCRSSCWPRCWRWSSPTPATGGLPGGGSAALRAATSSPLIAIGPGGGRGAVVGALLARREPTPAAARHRQAARRTSRWSLMLVLLPAVQAAGTGNPLAYLAVNQFACWAALMVAACTMPGRVPLPRAPRAWRRPACAVVVAATTGADGLAAASLPDGRAGREATDDRSAGPVRWRPSKVDRNRGRGSGRSGPPCDDAAGGRPTMAFDEMAGLVLLLDGRSVGEAWYSHIDPARTAAGIRSVCTRPRPWGDTTAGGPLRPGARAPSTRRPCAPAGSRLARDYRLVTIDRDVARPAGLRPGGRRGEDATMTEPPCAGRGTPARVDRGPGPRTSTTTCRRCWTGWSSSARRTRRTTSSWCWSTTARPTAPAERAIADAPGGCAGHRRTAVPQLRLAPGDHGRSARCAGDCADRARCRHPGATRADRGVPRASGRRAPTSSGAYAGRGSGRWRSRAPVEGCSRFLFTRYADLANYPPEGPVGHARSTAR